MNSQHLNSYTSYSILLLVIIERSPPACHSPSFTSHTGHGMQTRQKNGIKLHLQTNTVTECKSYSHTYDTITMKKP